MHLKEQLGILVIILEICKGIGWCSGLNIGALEGEIAILTCKENARSWSELQNSGFTVEWSVNTSSGFLKLTQTEKVFFEFNTLRFLGVTLSNTGVYKCTLRNETDIVESEQLELEVYNGKCYNKNYEYLHSSFVNKATNLICPEMELFSSTKHRVTWVKDCDQIITSKKNMHIARTQIIHAGHYTCIYSVEYDGKEYNISKTINLVVKGSPESMDPKMTFPFGMVEIEVEIGKETTINCTAILYKNDPFVALHWQKNDSFVSKCEDNNHVCSEDGTIEHTEKQPHNSYRMISPLIFKNVQEEHLNMKYDCILSSTMKGGNGSIILKKKVISTDISHSSFSSGIIMVVVLMITIVTVIVICVLLKVDIVLMYRAITGKDETIGDFKEYDAYVTYDKASSTSSYAEEERTFALEVLPKVLEEQLGYQLCIYERDVLPGGESRDNSFSRSRSSSVSSIDKESKETITALYFMDSYGRKNDGTLSPCLWVGTSLGVVLVISLNLPSGEEQRQSEPVMVAPSGTVLMLKGAVLTFSSVDCAGGLIHPPYEVWRDPNSMDDNEKPRKRKLVTFSPSSSQDMGDYHFAVICSEKQAKVYSLPSQTCLYAHSITESSFVLRADVVTVCNSVCLACFCANGHIMTLSLPSLRPMLDVNYLPLTDMRIARTFCFTNGGQALFLSSPTEVQRITFSQEMCENLQDMLGELFTPVETPEAQNRGFLKGLFGGSGQTFDREELFGEAAAGKASRSLAQHIPGPGSMEGMKAAAGGVVGDLARARIALDERGQRLGELEDRTAAMMGSAESFSKHAHELMLKCKDKKWYQL